MKSLHCRENYLTPIRYFLVIVMVRLIRWVVSVLYIRLF